MLMLILTLIIITLGLLIYQGIKEAKSIAETGKLNKHETEAFSITEQSKQEILDAPAKKAREFSYTRGSLAELKFNNPN